MNDAVKYIIITGGAQNSGENALIEVMACFIWALAAKQISHDKKPDVTISEKPPYIKVFISEEPKSKEESKMKDDKDKGPDIKDLKTFNAKFQTYVQTITTGRTELKKVLNRLDEYLKGVESNLLIIYWSL